MRSWFWLVAFALVQAIDLVSTYVSIVILGMATEINPLLAWCLGQDPMAFVVAKTLLAGIAPTLYVLTKDSRALAVVRLGVWLYLPLMLWHLAKWVAWGLSL